MSSPVKYSVSPGDRFGRGVVVCEIRIGGKVKSNRGARLLCDCGTLYETLITSLFRGSTQSCGCRQKELAAERRRQPDELARLRRQATSTATRAAVAASNTRTKTTHGLSHTHPLYGTWVGVMHRCFDEKTKAYPNYGGRGITICERWRDVRNFVADIESEIGPKPADPKLTLDRTDNNGNYEPGNIRWATRKQQVLNRRPDKGSLAEQRIAELEARIAVLEGRPLEE